ncbi:hypothetical protein B7494_g6531 [Chlorociboria aeruginascens]|nr:hypothetical protein B7494_g6531 [Chlorociboria aeruginascens]
MSLAIPSDEVAEDFYQALQDLTLNSRYEISNLTSIARDYTEHALAISEALKNHIKQTSPPKKLPAFYVLDSIVKNVGTPYTLFFGRQLFSTFMEAYALVDNNVRRKMEEMLRTWKEPLPGSIDTRPVFPSEVTRPIENALIKARTSAVQAHQEHMRSQQQMLGRGRPVASPAPYRDTPTPPNIRQPMHGPPGYGSSYGQQPQYPSVNGQSYASPSTSQPPFGLPQRPPNPQYPPQSVNASSWQPPQPQSYRTPEVSIDTLNNDVSNLISASRADFAQAPWDSSIQGRLKALLDLQIILQNQKLPPDQLVLVKNQISQLSEAAKRPNIQPPQSLPPAPVAAPQSSVQQISLSSLLGPSALAALLARNSATQAPTPHVQPAPTIRSPLQRQAQYPPPPNASTPVPDPTSLLERLRAAGMLPAPPPTTGTATLPNISAGSVPPNFPPHLPSLNTPPLNARTPLAEIPNDVILKPASLKIPRPHLIASLYEKLGAPCTQCGRRFQPDEEGKKKKTAHMDWHFRVHQRMTEAEKRGQHRSWYVDELVGLKLHDHVKLLIQIKDWIKSRESEDDQNVHFDNANGSRSSNNAATKPKIQYLPVPDDPALANSVCPICQEKFEMKWLDDAQEFVWMDAQQVGDRIYHATCYAEATKDEDSSQIKRGTPDRVLGKRKAEVPPDKFGQQVSPKLGLAVLSFEEQEPFNTALENRLKLPSSSQVPQTNKAELPESASAQSLVTKSPETIKLLQGDLDDCPAIFSSIGEPIKAIFCVSILALGFGNKEGSSEAQGKALIDEALSNGVEHVVFTSVDRGSDAENTNIPYFISKAKTEGHLKHKTDGTKMTWTILRPTAFMDNITPDFCGQNFWRSMAG